MKLDYKKPTTYLLEELRGLHENPNTRRGAYIKGKIMYLFLVFLFITSEDYIPGEEGGELGDPGDHLAGVREVLETDGRDVTMIGEWNVGNKC